MLNLGETCIHDRNFLAGRLLQQPAGPQLGFPPRSLPISQAAGYKSTILTCANLELKRRVAWIEHRLF